MKNRKLKQAILCAVLTSIFYLLYINRPYEQENKNKRKDKSHFMVGQSSNIKTKIPESSPNNLDDTSKNRRASVCPTNENPGYYSMLPINPAENRSKVILMWDRPVDWMYQNTKQCEYKNCYLIDDKCDITRSDAVMFFAPKFNLKHVPKKIPGQIYVYFNFEPPCYTRGRVKNNKWQNFFNWTFHYRRDSDIMQPYVLFKKRHQNSTKNQEDVLEDLVKKKNKTIAWFVSHCKTESRREKYVDNLQKLLKVDIYGKCGPLKCKSMSSRWECLDLLDEYHFYLGFENSICRDYVTEKQLFTAYLKNNIISVTRGSSLSYLYKPPGTYIDTADFKTITDLSKHLKDVASNPIKYKSYFKIRNHFTVVEQWHYSVCELCKRLNNVDQYKRLYNDVHKWENEIDGQPICDENPIDYTHI